MPLYEYECESCGERFELIRKFSDLPVDVCARCGKGPVTRLFSSPAIQFKGSGFYITDYAKKGEGGNAGEGGKEGAKGEGGKGEESKKEGGAAVGVGSDTSSKPDARKDTTTKSESSTSAAPTKTGGAKD